MLSKYRSSICILGKYMQNNVPLMLSPINYAIFNNSCEQVRYIRKHYDPKFRKDRAKKIIPPPRLEKKSPAEEMKMLLKRLGIFPRKTWSEKPVIISTTNEIIEGYVVPEGDGKFSPITTTGAKQNLEFIEKKSKSFLALRKIKSYDDEFSTQMFRDLALDIYKKSHEILPTKDPEQILQYVTEYAYSLIMNNLHNKTVVWKFIQSLEPARLVHARVSSTLTKENLFAQVTIRFHTQQILCIYDRFGRLIHGSETVVKDVLDYIVFEKHLSNVYGVWRVHAKIIPDWMKPQDIPKMTYILKPNTEDVPVEDQPSTTTTNQPHQTL